MLRQKQKIKAEKVLKIKKEFESMATLVAVNYKALKVNDFQDFKNQIHALEDKDIKVKIFKNTLLKRAFSKSKFESLSDFLNGMIFIIYTKTQNLQIIKEVKKLQEKFPKKVSFKVGFFENEIRDDQILETLANIPEHNQLLVNLVTTIKLVPLNLIWTLKEVTKLRKE